MKRKKESKGGKEAIQRRERIASKGEKTKKETAQSAISFFYVN